jgi:hypothetical protein
MRQARPNDALIDLLGVEVNPAPSWLTRLELAVGSHPEYGRDHLEMWRGTMSFHHRNSKSKKSLEQFRDAFVRERSKAVIKEFKSKAMETDGDSIVLWRCVSVPNALKYAQDFSCEEVGVHWTWDQRAAICHGGDLGDSIVFRALVKPSFRNIDVETTLHMQFHSEPGWPSKWPFEKEIRLRPGAEILITDLYAYQDEKGNCQRRNHWGECAEIRLLGRFEVEPVWCVA